MQTRTHDLWIWFALAALVVLALVLASGAKAATLTWDSPISPITTPNHPIVTLVPEPGIPTGFTPTPPVSIDSAPTTPEPVGMTDPTPTPQLEPTPIVLLPPTGSYPPPGAAAAAVSVVIVVILLALLIAWIASEK